MDDTEEGYRRLSEGIREMAKELPASAVEIAGVAEAAGQLGIQNEHILSFTRTMIDLGEATNLTAEQAATEFARFANIVGMSQKDFDRLGSTVVDLGNNLATTEAEIVSMAMRIAGAGAQVGLTEAQIMSFAGALSSVGIEAEAGGSAFSRVMINIANEVETGGDKLEQFARVAGMSAGDFATAFQKDAAGAILAFITGLGRMSEEGENVFGVLEDLGLSEIRVRDALLRASNASDVFTESLEMGSRAWEENTALTEEAEQRYNTTESQLRMMWNRIKDVAITLGNSLVPAVMSALDAAEPLIQKIEEGAQAFADMDEEQQRTILKMLALTAAVGPAAVVMGNLTTATGGLLRMGGRVATMLGTASATGKGTGLLGAIAAMGPAKATPVGLAVAGVAALTGGLYYLSRDMRKLHDVSTDTADALMEQYQSNNDLIDSFDELRQKSNWTNDEFARYLDLQTRLESETRPEAIKTIKDAMEELEEKSGLSNDELEEMIRYNNDIVEVLPESTSQITEQGNRIADTTDNLRDYNQEIANMAKRELEAELHKALANELEIREQIKEAQRELNHLEETESGLREIVRAHSEGTLDLVKEQLLNEKEKLEDAYREAVMRGEVTDELSNQIERNEALLSLADADIDRAREKLSEIMGQVDEQRNLVEEKHNELEVTGEIVAKMVEYELIAAGINEETAKQAVKDAEVSSLLDDQLEALRDQRRELEKQFPPAMQMTDEYKEAKSEIDGQINRLQRAKRNIEDLIDEAGEYNRELAKDVDKKVNVQTSPSISRLDSDLTRPLVRNLNIRTNLPQAISAYADGTNYHPGGPAWLGEEGPELVQLGNRWSLAGFGLYDLARGAKVYPNDDTKRILRAINSIPGYASGVGTAGETNRVVNEVDQQATIGVEAVHLLQRIANAIEAGHNIMIDGEKVVRTTINRFDEGLKDLAERRRAAWGG